MKLSKIKKIIESIKDTPSFDICFTHSSYKNENSLSYSYESMEWLGDAVLGLHTADYIYHKFQDFSEGQKSKLRQFMVQESTIAEVSKRIGLAKYLKLGEGERKNNGIKKVSILSDIFESFIGALYIEKEKKMLGKGSYYCQLFLNLTLFKFCEGKENFVWDYKSKIQQICQANKQKISYNVVHLNKNNLFEDKINSVNSFLAELIIEDNDNILYIKKKGRGKSKKEAEQKAAYKALKFIENNKKKNRNKI